MICVSGLPYEDPGRHELTSEAARTIRDPRPLCEVAPLASLPRSVWASCHGLEPDDGAYLSELSVGALTIRQLGEALAVCGQSREMITSTVNRLASKGFLDALARGEPSSELTVESARLELATACVELDCVRR